MFTKRILPWLLLACLLLCTVVAAVAEQDEEDVTIVIYDANGNAVTGGGEDGTEPILTPTPEPKPTVDPTQPVYEADGSILLTMSFTGDVTIGSNTQSGGKSIFDKELENNRGDINFPFRNTRDIFLEDDVTMINFEGTLTTAGKNREKLENSFLFRADPSFVTMLPNGGVDTVSLENNHVLDMGADGLAETKKTLLDAGITYASEDEPAIFTVKGVTIGSLAYQTFGGRHDEIIAKLPAAIADLRSKGCDLVIISYHWGNEKDYKPNSNQVRLGRASIDAGADLVIGHHSHRINPIEYYNGKYICYSLGNFSFAGHNKPDDMSTYIFQTRMRVKDGELVGQDIKIIPCRISSRTDKNDLIPTPYTKGNHIEAVLTNLSKNGKSLEYAVEEYPLKWPDEE
ncbi:MAG: CapA family protein [Clostridia bacterium]|nr:CapA family protein [Clostridia bacterium]